VTYRVLFTPEAEDHLDRLDRYIAEAAHLGIFTAVATTRPFSANPTMTRRDSNPSEAHFSMAP
jgi:hypothetical protein